jgi:Zn-dependent protease with chaperone function
MDLCQHLPWWDAWLGPLLAVAVVLAPSVLGIELTRVRARRKLGDGSAHWSRRAIVAIEAKTTLLALGVAGSFIWLGAAGAWESASGCSPTTPLLLAGAGGLLALLWRASSAIDASYRGVAQPLIEHCRSVAVLVLVLYPVWLVVIACWVLSPLAPSDERVWWWMAGLAPFHLLAGTGVTYPLVRALGLAYPARENVVRAVERARVDVPVSVRRVDELAWLMPNAVALPLTGVVAFSKAGAEAMSDEELHAIALHELGHLAEPPLVRWGRAARGLLLVPYSAAMPLLASRRSLELVVLLVLSLCGGILARRWSRNHEKAADAHAGRYSAEYAKALETLHRVAGIPAVLAASATHPSLYDRMLAAGVPPTFPRPEPPRIYRKLALLLLVPVAAIVLSAGASFFKRWLWHAIDGERAAHVGVALGGHPEDLVLLAEETQNSEMRALLYRRALVEDPDVLRARAAP